MSARPNAESDRVSVVTMLLLAVAAPLATRAVALVESGTSAELADARGVLLDLAVGLVVAAGVASLARRARWAAVAGAAAWYATNALTLEYVLVHGGLPALQDAHYLVDPTFLKGSVAGLSRSFWTTATILAGVTGAIFATRRVRGRPWAGRVWAIFALCGLVGLVSVQAWPTTAALPSWRQGNFVTENVFGGSRSAGRALAADDALAAPYYRPDLDGVPRATLPQRGMNVLLIVLEGASTAFLPNLAGPIVHTPELSMHGLDRQAGQSLAFQNIYNHQIGTNRGLYTLLCGDFPKLAFGQAKMSELVATGEDLQCLPRILAEHGYSTAYLQAAPLAFMMKDQFMPAAGFQSSRGLDYFGDPEVEGWGVDDKTFFDGALRRIDELQGGHAPWFLTLLTVGTHHPYEPPSSYEGMPGATPYVRSFSFLDDSISTFLESLKERGLGEDTLVIVTSDESAAAYLVSDTPAIHLRRNLGLMLLTGPGVVPGRVTDLALQSDLALSVLDYLGMAEAGGGFVGRSLFRAYARERRAVFGSGPGRRVGVVDPVGNLSVCDEALSGCARFSPTADGALQAASEDAAALQDARLARALVRRSEISLRSVTRESPATRPIGLLVEPAVNLDDQKRLLFDAQLVLPKGMEAQVRLDLRVEGRGGKAWFAHGMHDGRGGATPLLHREYELRPGMELSLEYTLRPENAIDVLLVAGWGWASAGEPLKLVAHVAQVTVRPRTGDELSRTPLVTEDRTLWPVNDKEGHFSRALEQMGKKDYLTAIDEFEQFLQTHAGHPTARTNIAYCLRDLGRPGEARAMFTEVLDEFPGTHDALYGLALVQEESGDSAEAATTWRRYVAEAPASGWKDKAAAHLAALEAQSSP